VGAGIAADLPAHTGSDYWVSLEGHDFFPGTEELPFKSIRKASATVEAGGTVYIHGGVYSDPRWIHQLDPINSGTANAWITYRNVEGELPIIDGETIGDGSGVEPLTNKVSYIRFQGLVSRNWKYSGFDNGWDDAIASDHIEYKYCIADNNGVNGIAFYKAASVKIENNIVSRNGHTPPSWSSGVNIYRVQGTADDNVIRNNVVFDNIDVCGIKEDQPNGHPCDDNQSSDGNAFVLDESGGSARFQNNIAFNNGGSCFRVTKSPGTQLTHNTCYNNCADTTYMNFGQTEIFFSDQTSVQDIFMVNNLAVTTAGSVLGATSGASPPPTGTNTYKTNTQGSTIFQDPDNADFRIKDSAANGIVDSGQTNGAAPDDIGFDPGCIKKEQGQFNFWKHAPNYEYIESVGGVEGCFKDAKQRSGTPDMGAYEK
jgi:parallel beta-helix repeat protein